MRFFVAKDEPFTFSYDYIDENTLIGKCGIFTMKYQVNEGDFDQIDKRVSGVLERLVTHFLCAKRNSSGNMAIVLTSKPECLFLGQKQETFLKDIGTLFGEDNVRARVTLSFIPTPNSMVTETDNTTDVADNYLSTKEMTVAVDEQKFSCMDEVRFSNSETCDRFLVSGSSILARLTVEVTVNTKFIRPQAKTNKENLLGKMLHNEIHSDITITAENGNKIKCHKSVLSACSPVFAAMFTTDMQESKTHNVDLPEMSEQVITAFLNYIYCKNEDEPSKNCEIALELLNAADKYDVTPDLETAMINLILSKPIEWFNVDVGVQIFLLARNIPSNGDALKEKAVKILKQNIATLSESEMYLKMFQENPTAATELYQLSFGSLPAK